MALFDPTIHDVPRLPRSERYSLALAHETGKVSAMGHRASALPPRRKGDPTDDSFDESRMRPTSKRDVTLFIGQAPRTTGDMAKHPITGDPIPVEGAPGKSVAGLGDYPRDYSVSEPSPSTIIAQAKAATVAERIAASRAAFNAERKAAEKARIARRGW